MLVAANALVILAQDGRSWSVYCMRATHELRRRPGVQAQFVEDFQFDFRRMMKAARHLEWDRPAGKRARVCLIPLPPARSTARDDAPIFRAYGLAGTAPAKYC